MPKGFFNPKNYAPDTGGSFKEGLVRVDQSCFKVNQVKPPDPLPKNYLPKPPFVALVWNITRLDEDQKPLETADGDPVTEVLSFGLGGKSIGSIHPGNASGPDDEEVEDLDVEPGTEGNTLFFTGGEMPQLHPKTGVAHLIASLRAKGFKEEYLERVWAPDYKGLVCFMKAWFSDDPKDAMVGADGKERPVPYKVVDKILSAPYEKKGKAAAAGAGSAGEKAASNGKNSEAEATLKPILEAISTELAGETISKKALSIKVGAALQKAKVDAKAHVPILGLVKDDGWLKKNGSKYDMTFDADENQITFGGAEAE